MNKKTIALAALCLGFFMVIMDVTIVIVALPNIAQALHTSISGLQWIIAGYTLTFAGFLLTAGHLADSAGAKKTLMIGLLFFILTSLACSLAPSIQLLVLFRVLQGLAASTLIPCSLALIHALFDNENERAKAIGIWGGMGGIAAASGPVLGALLISAFSWRMVFAINIPLGILALLLINHYTISTKPRINTHFDMPGQLLAIVSITSLALALIEAGRFGWDSMLVMGASGLFFLSLIAFIFVEKRSQSPMLPIQFFKVKNFSIAVIIGLFINVGLYGLLFILPFYFVQVRGYNTLQTGFAILPLFILVAIASYLSGKVASVKGAKLPLLLGLLIALLGFFGLLMVNEQPSSYYWLIVPLATTGFGIAFTMPAAMIIAIQAVPKNHAGIASAVFTTSRQVGSLIGIATFGTIITRSTQFIQGMQLTLMIAGLLFLFGFLLVHFVSCKL